MATFCDNASIPYTPYDTLAAVAEGIERFAGSRPTAAAVALPERYFPPYKQQDPSRNLLELERKYCSWGDTVHYLDPPKCFERSEGSYLYDREGTPYLDLQMWYSAANLRYGNRRLNAALTRQLETLPQNRNAKGGGPTSF